MVTPKLDELLRQKWEVADKHGMQSNEFRSVSDDIVDELIDNCQPTQEEFERYMHAVVITSHSLYRLLTEFRGK